MAIMGDAMRILITGASGFIGGRFALFALEQGLAVRVNGRRAECVQNLIRRGAEFVQGDLCDAGLAQMLCRDVEAVVHCAGAVGASGDYAHFHQANVTLTENIVDACLKQKVRRLIHLSSPSIYFDGKNHVDIREEHVPARFYDHYGKTKYLAEQRVFAAQEFGLEVIALRPRFVTGAGRPRILSRLIGMHRKGSLAIVGNGLNKVDFTSVHNLNYALLNSLHASGAALGQAYNISNGAPVPMWDVVNYVLRRLDLPPVTKQVSFPLAYATATLKDGIYRMLPAQRELSLFRMGVAVMAKDFSLNIDRAREVLRYEPKASLWDALDEFCDWHVRQV